MQFPQPRFAYIKNKAWRVCPYTSYFTKTTTFSGSQRGRGHTGHTGRIPNYAAGLGRALALQGHGSASSLHYFIISVSSVSEARRAQCQRRSTSFILSPPRDTGGAVTSGISRTNVRHLGRYTMLERASTCDFMEIADSKKTRR